MKLLKRKTRGLVGFDLGARCVKAAQVVLRGGEYRLRAAAIVPRKAERQFDDLLNNAPTSFAGELKAATSISRALAGRDAAAVLSMSLCDVVQVDPPTGKRAGAAELVRVVQSDVHRWSCESVVDTWPAVLVPKKINAVAAPRPWSDQAALDVAAAGWDCRLIDALPWAIGRAAWLVNKNNARRTIVALDWGYSRATLVLVHNGVPALVRCLKDCPFERTIEAIEAAFRVARPNAERLLAEQILASSEAGEHALPAALVEVIAAPLARLVQETDRTLCYWRTTWGENPPQSLYLFGVGAGLPGIDQSLGDATGLAAERWSLPVDSPDRERLPPHYLVGAAAGLSAAAWESS